MVRWQAKKQSFQHYFTKKPKQKKKPTGKRRQTKPGPPTKQLMVMRGVDTDTNMMDVSIAKTEDTTTENRYKSSWRKGFVNPIVGRDVTTARVSADSGALHDNVEITGVSVDNGTTPINKRTADENAQDDKEIE